MPTTAKRGRPAKKTTEAPVQEAKKFSVRQDLSKENEIKEYRLIRGGGAVHLMSSADVTVYDKKSDQVRAIRYCPSETSIYKDEQSENAIRQPVIFADKRIFVRPDQPNLRNYLDLHPGNRANGGGEFYLVNKQKKAAVDVDKEFVLADAISLVRTKELDDLLAVAAAYGINVDRNVAEIRHDLIVAAKKNPAKFIKSFDNPEVLMKAKLRMASKYGIIDLSQSGVRWKDSGSLIVSVPAGKAPLDVMLRFCLTEAGAPTVEELDRQLQ